MAPPIRLVALLASLALFLVPSLAQADTHTYVGAATLVAREDGQTVFDNGAVLCSAAVASDVYAMLTGGSQGVGAGGVCMPFDGSGTVSVVDPTLSDPEEVAFQVCIDNDQDNLCSLPETPSWDPLCPDWIRFSHKGPPAAWANPMANIPTSLLGGSCPGPQLGAWDGIIVFVCSGVHETHEHKTAAGQVTTGVSGGTDGFDASNEADVYCGPPPGVPAVKAYAVAP